VALLLALEQPKPQPAARQRAAHSSRVATPNRRPAHRARA
jgi:hypothetical protein